MNILRLNNMRRVHHTKRPLKQNGTRPPLYHQGQPQAVPAFAASNLQGILCGYWFEWEPRVALTDIPPEYNPICVAFLIDDGLPAFKPYFYSEQEIIDGIKALKAQGRDVLISMGGASGYFSVWENEKTAFKDELLEIIERYGFNGADIDLEGDSIKAGDNNTVIPAVLREIKDYYRSRGERFLITMAPEFRYLRGSGAAYKPYVDDLTGYYDFCWPQYYNQGADGIWSERLGVYLSQNDNARKADFLYALTHAIVTGTQDFLKIPADKFAIGLPASPVAALNGYVQNPADVRTALQRLENEGNAIRGLMTWSINQDSASGFQFARRYYDTVRQTGGR